MCEFKGNGEEFNFSSNEEISISSLVEMVCDLTKVDKTKILKFGPERPGKDKYYRLNIEKSKRVLNWEPKVFLDQGLDNVNSWISKNINNLTEKSWEYNHKN